MNMEKNVDSKMKLFIVHLADDQLRMIARDTCGMYQIYFYIELFKPLENNSVF